MVLHRGSYHYLYLGDEETEVSLAEEPFAPAGSDGSVLDSYSKLRAIHEGVDWKSGNRPLPGQIFPWCPLGGALGCFFSLAPAPSSSASVVSPGWFLS